MSPYAELVEPAPTFARVDSPIEVTFNRPMARQTIEKGFRIKPDVPGTFRWVDDKTLRFEPTKLAYQTQYQIELTGLSASGEPLRGLTSWTFTTQKPITLTIDDCGTEAQLRTILAVLAERRMKAMMFANGWCAARFPWLVNAMLAGGHQVCNHTYSHPHLTRLTDAQVIAEIKTGQLSRNCDWVKPPFDDVDARVDRLIRSQGYRTLSYDVDSLDWQGVSADVMLTRALSTGGIISIHFWGANTIEFLRRLPQP
jgi:peptidoglycan/xylan/chitin deacetylase (PgdA/CDA1 family)